MVNEIHNDRRVVIAHSLYLCRVRKKIVEKLNDYRIIIMAYDTKDDSNQL
jgi:hypothetical protein